MLTFSDFPGHVRLMLLAARSHLTADETRQIIELAAAEPTPSDTLDWDDFVAVTEHHRLGSLVYSSLDAIRPPGLPTAILERLRSRATVNAFEALRSTAEVRRISATFADAGFELSILKGVPLSQILFGNPNARHVGDIDLLTTPHDLPHQIELLGSLGYELINPRSRLTPHRIASYVSFWKDFTFRNDTTGFELDLHWRLFNNRFHAANRLLAEPAYTTVTAFNLPMRVFSLEDQFIYIAAHGISDAWTYLKSLSDAAAFLRIMSPAELDHALERARSLGLLAQISAAIHLANDWMGANARSQHLLAPDERISRTVRERATTMLLRQEFKPVRNFPSPFDWLQLEMKLVPGVRSLTELARRFVWRPRVWASVDLPDRFFWFYPILGLLLPPSGHSVED